MKSIMVKNRWAGTIIAGILTALLLISACGPSPTEPTGKKIVEIGDITPITGPVSSSEQGSLMALQDYVRYFNEEIGIPDVTIELTWVDNANELSRFISSYRRFIARGIPVLHSNYTPGLEALKSDFEKDQIPVVPGVTMGLLVYPPGWIYCSFPTFGEASTSVIDYFMENWKEDRPPRLAYIGIESPFGREPAAEGTKYAESIGMEVLPLEIVPYVVIDSTSQLLRLKERGADLVYLQLLQPGMGPILKDADRLGILDDMQFSGNEFGLGDKLIQMAGPASEGFLAPRSTPWFDELEVPGIELINDVQMKYHGKLFQEPTYMGGWCVAAIICEAIKIAIEEVGYENIDGLAIKEAMDTMKDFNINDLVTISYSEEQRRGSRMAATYEIRDGKIVRVSDWREAPILVP